MQLNLSVISKDRYYLGDYANFTLDESDATIGRHKECDWILEDTNRFISSVHIRIHYQQSSYFVTDLSTNGTFLNNRRLTPGAVDSTPLKTGDLLVLGDIKIEVSITDESQTQQHVSNNELLSIMSLLDKPFDEPVSSRKDQIQTALEPDSITCNTFERDQARLADMISHDFPHLDHGDAIIHKREIKKETKFDMSARVPDFYQPEHIQLQSNAVVAQAVEESALENADEILKMVIKVLLVQIQKQLAVDRFNNPVHYHSMPSDNILRHADSVEAVFKARQPLKKLQKDVQEVLDYLVQCQTE